MNSKKIINTTNAPAAIGPYSQAVRAGDLVFVSGQLPINPETGEFAGNTASEQAAQSLKNIASILAAEGLTMANAVKLNVFLKDMNDFAAVNEVYASFFEGDYPARAAVEVARLPKDALVEIEAIAYCG